MTTIKLNRKNHTIEITKAFNTKASKYGTDEYNMLIKACNENVLHVTPDEILTEDSPALSMQQEELMQRLNNCSPKDKETALKILSAYLQSLE